MSRVLVVGAHPFDSGKTQLAIRLGESLIESGTSVNYFKPVSGHNYWYNYEHTKRCLEKQQLVSKDVKHVKERLDLDTNLLLMNPIHSLFVPARISRPLQNISSSLGLSGATSVLVMQRFSTPTGQGIDTTVLVADELVEEHRLLIGLEEVGKLSHQASIMSANRLETFQGFEQQHFEDYVSKSFLALEKKAQIVLIECFNDSIWPWENLESVDNVLVVTPGHVFSYDPERFKKAAFLMKRGNLPIREVTFTRISDLLKPTTRVELRPDTNLSQSQLTELGF